MINWHLETRKIKDLKVYSKNPRQLSKDQERHLRASIDKFGLAEKVIINTDNTIIGGHQRLNILRTMKQKEVECWVPDRLLTEKEVEELNIRLNKNTGDWDYDILANQWELTDILDWGFTAEELELGDITQVEGEEVEEDALLEPPKDPVTKLGDLYELGPHRLLCGDSTMPDDVQKLLNGAEPILMVTDPPYGVNYDASYKDNENAFSKVKAKGKVQNDDRISWAISWTLFLGSIAYIWHADRYAAQISKDLENADFQIACQIIWVKQHGFNRGDYHWYHEPCWYAIRKGCNHNWKGDHTQKTVWEIDSLNPCGRKKESYENNERTAHSTQKPLECMARPIRNNTAKGEGVYDPFLGSGTTLIAAENLNRICYGLEIDPAYCDIIVDRYRKFMEKNGKPVQIKKNGETI